MAQRITIPQFKEAIQIISKAFKDLGEQKEINVLPLLGGIGGAGTIHLALMRINLMAQQLESDVAPKEASKGTPKEEVDERYKATHIIL